MGQSMLVLFTYVNVSINAAARHNKHHPSRYRDMQHPFRYCSCLCPRRYCRHELTYELTKNILRVKNRSDILCSIDGSYTNEVVTDVCMLAYTGTVTLQHHQHHYHQKYIIQ
jgi:hypothetical protein